MSDSTVSDKVKKIGDEIAGLTLKEAVDLGAYMKEAYGIEAAEYSVAGSVDAAIDAANAIGYPVVVKPTATDYGTAVSLHLRNADDVRRACGRPGRSDCDGRRDRRLGDGHRHPPAGRPDDPRHGFFQRDRGWHRVDDGVRRRHRDGVRDRPLRRERRRPR